jgi:hypothetical protein
MNSVGQLVPRRRKNENFAFFVLLRFFLFSLSPSLVFSLLLIRIISLSTSLEAETYFRQFPGTETKGNNETVEESGIQKNF